MPIKVTCPKCQGVLHAPDDAGGKRGKCPTCGTVLAIPAESPRPVAEPPEPFRPQPQSRPLADPPEEAPRPTGYSRPPETGRSSIGGLGPRSQPDVRRESGNRLPTPGFGSSNDMRKSPTDPFARSGKPSTGDGDEGQLRAWKKTRSGLGWVRFALFLFLLPILGLTGISIAENYGTKLPVQVPGYLKLERVSSAQEIQAAVVLIPVALGLLCLTMGRFGAASVPRSALCRGLFVAAAMMTLLELLGVIAYGVTTGLQIANGAAPPQFLPIDDPSGIAQRAGLAVAVASFVLSELWFVVAMGRLGTALQYPRLAARGTRFLVLGGFLLVLLLAGAVTWAEYPGEIRKLLDQQVIPQLTKLGEHRATAEAGLIAFAGFIGWLWYARLVGAGRQAIREWTDGNGPT